MENRIYDAFKEIKAEEQLKGDTLKKIYEKADRRQHFWMRRTALAACASFALVLLLGMFSYNLYFTESAYIDIDVNPSIELTINRFNRVIDAYAYNEDGEKILAALQVKHKTYDKAVAGLMDEMEKAGYLRDDGLVSATVRTDWEEAGRLAKLEKAVWQQLQESHNNSSHEIYAVDEAVKEHAHEENVSPAKYLAIQELQKLAPETTVSGCKDHSISEIREEINSHAGETHDQGESDFTDEEEDSHSQAEDSPASSRSSHDREEGEHGGHD